MPFYWAIYVGLSMVIDGLVMILSLNYIKLGLQLKTTMSYAQYSYRKRNGNRVIK